MESTVLSNVVLFSEFIIIMLILILVMIIKKKDSILLILSIVLASAFFVHAILLGTSLFEVAICSICFAIPLLTLYAGGKKQ